MSEIDDIDNTDDIDDIYLEEFEKKKVWFYILPADGKEFDIILKKYNTCGKLYLPSILNIDNYGKNINDDELPEKNDCVVIYKQNHGILGICYFANSEYARNVKVLDNMICYQMKDLTIFTAKINLKVFFRLMSGMDSYMESESKFTRSRLKNVFYFNYVNIIFKHKFINGLHSIERNFINVKLSKELDKKKKQEMKDLKEIKKMEKKIKKMSNCTESDDYDNETDDDETKEQFSIPIMFTRESGKPFQVPKNKNEWKKYFIKQIQSNNVSITDNNNRSRLFEIIKKDKITINVEIIDEEYDASDDYGYFNTIYNAYENELPYEDIMYETLPHVEIIYIKNGHDYYDGDFFVCYVI